MGSNITDLELPEWFDNKKYNEAKNFDALDWWWNTHIRFEILGQLSNNKPLPLVESAWLEMTRNKGALSTFSNDNSQPLAFNCDEYSQKYILGDYDKFDNAGNDEICSISLNLYSSDKELFNVFKHYITEKRNTFKPKKKCFSNFDFNSFYKYGVLPYLDLEIWQKKEHIKLNNEVICQAIDRDVLEPATFRKTNKKHTDRIQEAGLLLKNQGVFERSMKEK